jgi:hypothetical protein
VKSVERVPPPAALGTEEYPQNWQSCNWKLSPVPWLLQELFSARKFPVYSHVICDLRTGTLVGRFGTRVPFSDSNLSFTLAIEQFWGRAARASRIRKNPDARLIFRQLLVWSGRPSPLPWRLLFVPSRRKSSFWADKRMPIAVSCLRKLPLQFVEMVKFTVMRACVSTGCPFCR